MTPAEARTLTDRIERDCPADIGLSRRHSTGDHQCYCHQCAECWAVAFAEVDDERLAMALQMLFADATGGVIGNA